jgi:glycosyltransferase domain-containing protein
MHSRKNLITILLPLWDKAIYTSTWVKENLFDDFDYIIADGSKSDANHAIFDSLSGSPNIKYIRYPFDASVTDYVKKMSSAVSKVETSYVMTCDNDDFLRYKGVVECINVLERNQDYGFAMGSVRSVTCLTASPENSRQYYRLRHGQMNVANLNGMSGMSAIRHLFRPYKYVWYGVYRSEIYKDIWKEISSSCVDDIFLIEYLQNQLAFCFAKLYAVNCTHYIRLANPATSSARQYAPDAYPSMHSIYFDKDYRAQVLKLGEIIANRLNVDREEIYDEYRYFYGNHGKPPRLRIQVIDAIYDLIYNFFSPPLGINAIRKLA